MHAVLWKRIPTVDNIIGDKVHTIFFKGFNGHHFDISIANRLIHIKAR